MYRFSATSPISGSILPSRSSHDTHTHTHRVMLRWRRPHKKFKQMGLKDWKKKKNKNSNTLKDRKLCTGICIFLPFSSVCISISCVHPHVRTLHVCVVCVKQCIQGINMFNMKISEPTSSCRSFWFCCIAEVFSSVNLEIIDQAWRRLVY